MRALKRLRFSVKRRCVKSPRAAGPSSLGRGFVFALALAPLLGSSGCSVIESIVPRHQVTAVELTVGRVTADYIQAVYTGNLSRLETFVNWPSMLGSGDEKITRAEFEKQLFSLQNRWTPEQHPLFNLEIADVDVNGDDAEVVLRRSTGSGYPKIAVTLNWVGNGWVIRQDSIFGRGKLAEKWQKSPQIFKN